MIKSSLFLCGPMGSGKSTVAALLGEKLAIPSLDTDTLVRENAGLSITEIFAREGEAGFRARERQAVQQAARFGPAVVALGGGALFDPLSREEIRKSGVLVYLKTCPEILAERLAPEAEERPLLASLSQEQRKEKLRSMLVAREPAYLQANWIVSTDGKEPQAVAEEITAWARSLE